MLERKAFLLDFAEETLGLSCAGGKHPHLSPSTPRQRHLDSRIERVRRTRVERGQVGQIPLPSGHCVTHRFVQAVTRRSKVGDMLTNTKLKRTNTSKDMQTTVTNKARRVCHREI